MFLIIGLGNPGLKYKKTRHNAGFQAVDFLADKNKFKKNKKLKSEIAKIQTNNQEVILAKPQTFMNNSGQAVKSLVDYYKIKPENIIVIYDELDLPFGEIRMKDKGSSAGHNGIKSIIENLKTENFYRIRIGIANEYKEKMQADKFVLKKFSKNEQKELQNKIFPEVVNKINKLLN